MSVWYDMLKKRYDRKSITKKGLKKAVKLEWITPEEYELITGEAYVA